MREAYYFNPKQVKRPQLTKLVTMLKDNLGKSVDKTQKKEEVAPIAKEEPKARKKNFFERKRFVDFGQDSKP